MIVAAAPIVLIGYASGVPPAHVRAQIVAARDQNRSCEIGRYIRLRCLERCSIGMRARPMIAKRARRTPVTLAGGVRRMA